MAWQARRGLAGQGLARHGLGRKLCKGHGLADREVVMTTLQAWILIILVGIIALAYLVGLFRGHGA
jgi:hypothetical protein